MKKINFVAIVVFAFSVVGCISQKERSSFYTLGVSSADSINKDYKTIPEARIIVGDLLLISVTGLDPSVLAPYNLPPYLVDVKGNINFPVVGTLKLAGLTKSQAIKCLNDQLAPYLKNIIVSIDFQNFTVSVLGEVLKPGQYLVENERVTVLSALAMAGDMTEFARRNNVLITRENNGKLEFARLNLNTDELFRSPYFYLQQNDVINVESQGFFWFFNKRKTSNTNLQALLPKEVKSNEINSKELKGRK